MSQLSIKSNRFLLLCLLSCASILFIAAPGNACGPFFPDEPISGGDARLLKMPASDFYTEIDALHSAADPPLKTPAQNNRNTEKVESQYVLSARLDEAELSQALKTAAVSEPDSRRISEAYGLARGSITDYSEQIADIREKGPPYPPDPKLDDIAVPPGLPAEFADYLSGLIAKDRGDLPAARKAWTQLLAQPPEQRRLRSTWAAFMLGKSYMTDDPAKARRYFAQTRELAAAAFSDSLDLATSSLGWEARTELNLGRVSVAMALYLRQHWAGDSLAVISLRESARIALARGGQTLADTARDEPSRRVMTAYIICNAGPYSSLSDSEKKLIPTWLAAVDALSVKDMPGADRLAWAAYLQGDFDVAGRWAAKSPAGAPVAQWVKAKLLLRDGKVSAAVTVLAKLVKSFPDDAQWLSDGDYETSHRDGAGKGTESIVPPVAADLAVLQLARGQYIESLDLLYHADYWTGAAYVADRVLTADELKAYVDKHAPLESLTGYDKNIDLTQATPSQISAARAGRIRYLLARRLTRLGRWKEARPYYPADMQSTLDTYVDAIRAGHDESRPAAERAKSFLTAARMAHDKGMELLGTEVNPDGFISGGDFSADAPDTPPDRGKLSGPSDDEIARYKANAPQENKRFHYRYIASDHAWAAAQLMPDDTDETAAVLYEAGCWIKDRNAKAADRFYKALVQRCPSTDLGKQAAALH